MSEMVTRLDDDAKRYEKKQAKAIKRGNTKKAASLGTKAAYPIHFH